MPTGAGLAAFVAQARGAGRRVVVGAVITDGAGRIYVQRRSPDRAVFPGCWDIVGGHLEGGETALEGLARELREETGWRLLRVGPVVEVLDWEANGQPRSEVDLLVTAAGDLVRPLLEPGKHDEGRWLLPAEAGVLLEGRSPDDRWVHEVVSRAFRLLSTWPEGAGQDGGP